MNNNVELVNLVDDNGKVVKENIPRSEADSYQGLHLQIIVAVIFDDQGRILVHKRSQNKKVNPSDIDHVCGGIQSGESPEQAAERESMEETGIKPNNLRVVSKGLNGYGRYRFLLSGKSNDIPQISDPSEAEWVKFMSQEELRAKQNSGELSFVDEFFEDTAIATHEFEKNELPRPNKDFLHR